MKKRKPIDGDAILTNDGFLFYTFGYEHPKGRYYGFLKYIPIDYQKLFNIEWLPTKWILNGHTVVRPAELYSPRSYREILNTLKGHFQKYIWFNDDLKKEMITVPENEIEKIYRPNESLMKLYNKKEKDKLEIAAIQIIELLAEHSGVSISNFGIHGSISLGSHDPDRSDVDISVYGALNFRQVLDSMKALEKNKIIQISRRNDIERIKQNTAFYKNTRFVVNATRLPEEIPRYDRTHYAIGIISAVCKVIDDMESVFRPAIYNVKCENQTINVPIKNVVSNIGMHRFLAKKNDKIRVKGILEKIHENNKKYYEIVIGTGAPDEFFKVL